MKLLYEAQITDEETGNVLTKISSYAQEGLEEEMGKGKWTKVSERKWLSSPDDHDCPLVGGHGEEGCDNPVHDRELIESKNF